MSRRAAATTLIAVGLTLAACGASDDAAPDTAPAGTAAPVTEPALTPSEPDADATADATTPADTDEPADADAAPTEPVPTEPTDSVGAGPEPEEPVATEAPAPAEAALGGRAFASELSPASDFAENILPKIQVDDIRRGTKINLANIFPAERPVLLWMWAPH